MITSTMSDAIDEVIRKAPISIDKGSRVVRRLSTNGSVLMDGIGTS